MGYTLPTFNLTCNIWRPTAPPPAPPAVVSVCNLAYGRRVQISELSNPPAAMSLLLPAGTDIRDFWCAGVGGDYVEVPAGSGRFYIVGGVDDVAKGFANEHRVATLNKTRSAGNWPAPIP